MWRLDLCELCDYMAMAGFVMGNDFAVGFITLDLWMVLTLCKLLLSLHVVVGTGQR